MPTYAFSVVNTTDQPLALIFYLDPQLVPAGRERVVVPATGEVRLLDIVSFSAGGALTFFPAEITGGRGTYDSLAIESITDRTVLDPFRCEDPRNALCIENYERTESDKVVSYNLYLGD